ncbi:hypothetical protein MTO96_045873, partial [Rhipicephalus appendiculatus]
MKITLYSEKTEEATTGSDGVVTFFIPTSNNDGVLSIEVATNDPRYPNEHQARERLALEPYGSVSNGFIGIQRKDPKSVVKVLSKGRVQLVKKLPVGRRLEENIVIRVTPEMTPSFRVVVFAVLDGRVVTDSIYVNAEPACTHTSHLFQSLDSKDLGCGAGGGVDAAEALSSAGVVLLTRNHVVNTLRSVEEYEDETLRMCCSRGYRRDQQGNTCTLRAQMLMDMELGIPNMNQDCVDAFM